MHKIAFYNVIKGIRERAIGIGLNLDHKHVILFWILFNVHCWCMKIKIDDDVENEEWKCPSCVENNDML